MPQTASLTIKAAINTESLEEKFDIDLQSYASAKDESFGPNEVRDFPLFGGSRDGVEFVFIKLAQDDPKTPAPNGAAVPKPPIKTVNLAFTTEEQEPDEKKWLELHKSMLLVGRAAKDLMPQKIERICVKNNLPVNVKVSVLLGRSTVPRPPKPLQKEGA